ncbi:MAG: O-antigen ligase family protein [Pseudomonadota bacterium]
MTTQSVGARMIPPGIQLGSARETPLDRLEFFLAAVTVALAPINYARLEAVYFTASDFVGVATLLVMLINRGVRLDFFGQVTPLWYCSFILFTGGLLIGSVASPDPLAGLVVFVQYLYSLLLIPLILASRGPEKTAFLAKVFVLSIAAVMLHGALVTHFVSDPSARIVSPSGRLRSLIERENAAGALAGIAITLSIFLTMVKKISIPSLLVIQPVLWYGLMLTGSNTGFITAVLGIMLLMVSSGSTRLMSIALPSMGVLAVAILLFGEHFLPKAFYERVFSAISSADISQAGTFDDRFALASEALDITNKTVFLGLGADQYRTISAYEAPVHNTYLLVLAEGGLISLLGLGGLFLTGFLIGFPAAVSPKTRFYGAIALSIAVLFALVLNSFAHFYARFWAVPLTLALALGVETRHWAHSTYPYRRS